MYDIENGVIHGASFAVRLETVEFLTWSLNEETSEYWVKFHVPSRKEIRIKVTENALREIVNEWNYGMGKVNLDFGDENGLDY